MNSFKKPTMAVKNLFFYSALFVLGCSSTQVPTFKIQHPARISIDRKIKKIFINPAAILTTSDSLKIKKLVLETLQKKLNQLGRFQVILGPVANVNPELETVAVVQGSITSREEVEVGQISEVATCKGGLAGYAEGATAASTSKQGITVSRRGLICKAVDLKSGIVGAGVDNLLLLSGFKRRIPPVDEVVRVYKYRNTSLFAQVDFSLTMIGKKREVITLRSDSANFSRHRVLPAINVHESYLSFGEAMQLLATPVAPLYSRRYGLVEATNPGHPKGKWYASLAKEGKGLSPTERDKIIRRLAERTLAPFIQTISPYKTVIHAKLDSNGDQKASQLILNNNWTEAQKRLENLTTKKPADWYHLGLVHEATAAIVDDYQEAKRLYLKAFEQKESKLFAEGIGRMERALNEAGKLHQQVAKK